MIKQIVLPTRRGYRRSSKTCWDKDDDDDEGERYWILFRLD